MGLLPLGIRWGGALSNVPPRLDHALDSFFLVVDPRLRKVGGLQVDWG